MHIIIMGPPGAGKGTQAEKMVNDFGLVHISTGDMFREAVKKGTEMGKKAKEFMDKGELVPDDVVVGIVKERLSQPDCKEGILLDGFPRTIDQAEALEEVLKDLNMKIDAVINVEVAEEELLNRLTGRRVCENCGTTYHVKYNTPKVRNICDHCGGELYQRSDDTVETVKERLQVYRDQTKPIIDYYRKKGIYHEIDGWRAIDEVYADVMKRLNNIKAEKGE